MTQSDKSYYYFCNSHGDVTGVVNSDKTTVATYDYEHAIIGTREEKPVISGGSELVPFSF